VERERIIASFFIRGLFFRNTSLSGQG